MYYYKFQNVDTRKTTVAIIYGGRSPEHKISLLSAQNVYQSLDKSLFDPILIGIDKAGVWHHNTENIASDNSTDAASVTMNTVDNPILLSQNTGSYLIVSATDKKLIQHIDIIFPVLHGAYGEDGSVQGLAKLADLPCVGCGILGSAVGMDKDIMKHILRSAGIPVAKWLTIRQHSEMPSYKQVVEELGQELFIKPANLGSSVGVSFSNDRASFDNGISEALRYDNKVIVEEKITGREIECAVLGNHKPKVSIPGEIVPKEGFYSYENKYLDEKGAELNIPAALTDTQKEKVQEVALNTYITLECRGMSRVDMFLREDDSLVINEINTIPGFTNISMYPKLWEATGLPQTALITSLIDLAIEEHKDLNKLSMS